MFCTKNCSSSATKKVDDSLENREHSHFGQKEVAMEENEFQKPCLFLLFFLFWQIFNNFLISGVEPKLYVFQPSPKQQSCRAKKPSP